MINDYYIPLGSWVKVRDPRKSGIKGKGTVSRVQEFRGPRAHIYFWKNGVVGGEEMCAWWSELQVLDEGDLKGASRKATLMDRKLAQMVPELQEQLRKQGKLLSQVIREKNRMLFKHRMDLDAMRIFYRQRIIAFIEDGAEGLGFEKGKL